MPRLQQQERQKVKPDAMLKTTKPPDWSIICSHHSVNIIPHFVSQSGKTYYVFERKDSGFKYPFFHGGLTFLGGNWNNGKSNENTPVEVAVRELREEFGLIREDAQETYDTVFGNHSNPDAVGGTNSPEQTDTPPPETCALVKTVGEILSSDRKQLAYIDTYINKISPPVMRNHFMYPNTLFSRTLSEDEFTYLIYVIKIKNGKLTTDNQRHGGETVVLTQDEINERGERFSWGTDVTFDSLLRRGRIPGNREIGIVRIINSTFFESRPCSEVNNERFGAAPRFENFTFRDFFDYGFRYQTH